MKVPLEGRFPPGVLQLAANPIKGGQSIFLLFTESYHARQECDNCCDDRKDHFEQLPIFTKEFSCRLPLNCPNLSFVRPFFALCLLQVFRRGAEFLRTGASAIAAGRE
jgi:hypothetical protein